MAASKPSAEQLITDNIDVWTSAIKKRGSQGRGSSKKITLYGIKKLRELILELAVRGLLVPQNSNDEPASVLLEKIAAEKEQLIKDGKLKKQTQKPLSPINENEKPFILPSGWAWARLGSIINISSGTGLTAANMNSDGGVPVYGGNGVTGYHDEGNISKRTLVIGRVGYYCGSVHITPKKAWVTDNAFITKFSEKNIDLTFLSWLLKATNLNENDSATAQPVISGRKLYPIVIALPPTDEQPRIVAKVNELMALCDQLEQQTESSLTAHQTLVETLLNTLLTAAQITSTKESNSQSNSNQESSFDQAWNRIAQHFDVLFTTEHSIDQLKQTILQLAVMGKLVPQDPSDEPASVLLEKIAAEKEQLLSNKGQDKKIKKQKALPPIGGDEKPFELPKGWEWCRLGDLALHSEAGWSPSCNGHPREGSGWGVLKVSAVSWGEYRPEENKELPSNLEPREQYEVVGGDFLISRANTAELVARAVVVPANTPSKLMMSDKIIRFSFSKLVEGEYVNLVNASQLSRDYYAAVAGGTSSSMKNVSREHIRNLVVALPPKNEAKRIFSQYASMLNICETLKLRISKSQAIQLHLADAMAENALV